MLKIMQSINGRIRWKHPDLKNSSKMREVEKEVSQLRGISTVRCNIAAGSIALTYDSTLIGKHDFEVMSELLLESLLPVGEKPFNFPNTAPCDKYAQGGALISLGVSMASLYVKNYYLHAVSGAVFLGFLGIHIYINRKTLLK